MKSFLLDLLIDPLTRFPLTLNEGSLIESKEGHTYEIIEGVPILLPKYLVPITPLETVHKSVQTSFDYQDHYQKDAEYFDYFKSFEDGATLHENKRLHQMILNKIPPQVGLVLDVGCGNGWVAKAFAGNNTKVISMDISTKNPIKVNRENDHDGHIGLVADAMYLPIKSQSVDVIIASEIIEHVADPKNFIASLYRVLKPGGKIIITTPYDEKIPYYLCVHCNQPTPQHAHLHSFNERNLHKYLPNMIDQINLFRFSNKYMIKLRSHIVLKYVPFTIWKGIDRLANNWWGKPTRFMVEITKPA